MCKITVITPTIRPTGLEIVRESLLRQDFDDFEWLVDINITGKHDLNKAFNSMVRRAKGELLVFYEDYTKIEKDGLTKFWNAYQEDKKALLTAPLGKVMTFADETVNWDWRKETTDIGWHQVELDWGAIPKAIIEDIGGFDERLDQWWSFDNVSVGKRAFLLGYTFKNIIDNPALAIDHDAIMHHPFRDKYNPPEVNKILNEYDAQPRIKML